MHLRSVADTTQKKIIIAFVVAVLVAGALLITQQSKPETAANIDDHVITREELDRELESRTRFFEQASQQYDPEVLKSNVLNGLIDDYLVARYAANNDIAVSGDEVLNYFNQRVAAYDNEEDFLAELDKLYGIDKATYLDRTRRNLLRDKVQAHLGDTPLSEWLQDERQSSSIEIY